MRRNHRQDNRLKITGVLALGIAVTFLIFSIIFGIKNPINLLYIFEAFVGAELVIPLGVLIGFRLIRGSESSAAQPLLEPVEMHLSPKQSDKHASRTVMAAPALSPKLPEEQEQIRQAAITKLKKVMAYVEKVNRCKEVSEVDVLIEERKKMVEVVKVVKKELNDGLVHLRQEWGLGFASEIGPKDIVCSDRIKRTIFDAWAFVNQTFDETKTILNKLKTLTGGVLVTTSPLQPPASATASFPGVVSPDHSVVPMR